MENIYEKAQEAATYIQSKISGCPKIAIILGTGLGELSEDLSNPTSISYEDIPHFPISTVQSHQGRLIHGTLEGKEILLMAGRFHCYEGYSAKEVTFPIRVFKELGVDQLIITNVAGGLNPHFKEGDIVIVQDHINLMPDHPLRGSNDERLGVRFPDMKRAYSEELIKIAEKAHSNHGYYLRRGVYVGLQGPSLETPAEYTFLNKIGGDLVGMSTVPEVIVAKHAEIDTLVLSMVSNVCYPPAAIKETTVEDVITVAHMASPVMRTIVQEILTLV